MQTSEQFRAEIERVSFRNQDNGWTVVRAKKVEGDESVTATGHFISIRPGDQFELFGNWSRHPQYGLQFKIERSVPVTPQTTDAIEKYLASGLIKGIGPKTAKLIVEKFGEKTFEILDENPNRVLEIETVGAKKAKLIITSWQEQRGDAEVMQFLSAHDLTPLFAARIYKCYGRETIKIVSKDPFRLANEIQGIGFLTADRIARSMGFAEDSPARIRAAILYQFEQAEDKGHCYLTGEQILHMLIKSLDLPETTLSGLLKESLDDLHNSGSIVQIDPNFSTLQEKDAAPIYYRSDLLAAEHNVARRIKALLKNPLSYDKARVDLWLTRYAEASGTALSEEQLDAVTKAVSARCFILTGGPGVGKTTTANAIIRLLKAMGKQVALGAPTGRAAQRLSEVAATSAKTIHRMLEWAPHTRSFSRNETSPLTVQAVIIDEASMIDIRLADALLRAVPDTAQMIFIGDVDQLPSVGPGNVLRDLIQSKKVPFTRLTQIFRQAQKSLIVSSAHAINRGEPPEIPNTPESDCRFIECDSNEEILSTIRDLMSHRLKTEFGYDPLNDAQILTPMNRGELGTQTLNAELQNLLNPETFSLEQRKGSNHFRVGDRVIQNANNYDLSVFNGDIGYVQHTKVEGGKLIVSFGEDRLITYSDEQALDLRLAYAITIHKSQGSEFPVVIIPCSMSHYIMLQRNLIYTALTRARRLAIFVGSKRALAHAVNQQASLTRQTGLIPRIAGMNAQAYS